MVLDIVGQRTPPQRTACEGQLEQGEAGLPSLPDSEDSSRKLLPPCFSLSLFFFLIRKEASSPETSIPCVISLLACP